MGHQRLFDPDKGYNVPGETLNYFLTLGIKISNLRIFNTGRRVLITRFKSKNIWIVYLQPPASSPQTEAFVPTVGVSVRPQLSRILQLRQRWLHCFVNPLYLKCQEVLKITQLHTDSKLFPSNSLYITLFSSARTSSTSFWLCWSDRQPRTCFSDSSNSSNSARNTFTWINFEFYILTNTKEKTVNNRATSPSDHDNRQPVSPGFRLMCVWKTASHFLVNTFVLHCVLMFVWWCVWVCQQYHP